jgi:hypothetical protein
MSHVQAKTEPLGSVAYIYDLPTMLKLMTPRLRMQMA